MGTLLDTTVFIELERALRGRPTGNAMAEAINQLERQLGPTEDVGIAAITASELLHGVHRATAKHRPRREAFIEAVLTAFPPSPSTFSAPAPTPGSGPNPPPPSPPAGASEQPTPDTSNESTASTSSPSSSASRPVRPPRVATPSRNLHRGRRDSGHQERRFGDVLLDVVVGPVALGTRHGGTRRARSRRGKCGLILGQMAPEMLHVAGPKVPPEG